MDIRPINAPDAPSASGSYSQALEVGGATRLLFVSGQIPETPGGTVPQEFRQQCVLVWRNIEAQLTAAGMTLDNLVKVTTFLADRRDRELNSEIRRLVLGARTPALTVVVAGIYDPRWLLEIEAIAAA